MRRVFWLLLICSSAVKFNLNIYVEFHLNSLNIYIVRFVLMFLLFFALVQDRDTLSLKLEDTENWLYEDGEDQPKQVYIDKLDELKVTVSVWLCDAGFKHTWCITTTVLKLFCPVYRNWANPFKTDTQSTRSGQKLLMSWENSFSSTWRLWRPSRWRLVLITTELCIYFIQSLN